MRALATVLLVACSGGGSADTDDTDTADTDGGGGEPLPEAPSYAERGPWGVGTARVDIVGTDDLSIPVQIWYPTTATTGTNVVYDGLLGGDAWEDAPPDCAEAHPLLAFSHGYAGIRFQSAFFTEFLASHGYVVVAPDHVGNTFLDASGDVVELFSRRPVDVRDAVDWVFAESADAGSAWAGCVDESEGYAVSGHSFGGYTAFAAAGAGVNILGDSPDLGDDRVWAVLAMAPWDGEGALTTGTSLVTVPTLVLTGARDETTPLPRVQAMFDSLEVEPRTLGVFPDAGHYSFSPVACLLETDDGCGEGFIALDRFTALVNTSGAAFLEGTRGVPGAIAQLPLDAAEIEWTTVP